MGTNSSFFMVFSRTEDPNSSIFVRWFGPRGGAVALFIWEILQVVVVALILIAVVRQFLIKPFVVRGASMEPNFYDSEYLIIDELSYRFHTPARGEVVVFHPPERQGNTTASSTTFVEESEQFYIKRIIGLPGERVEVKNGHVTIYNTEHPNGVVLGESYINEYTGLDGTWDVPADYYFVLGDNREHSLDSRVIGPIPMSSIIGKVWVRGFPLDRAMTISVPEYNI